MIFNFFSRRVNTETRPGCPRCARPQLERQVSRFAISKGRKEGDDMPDIDESRMERAMQALAAEAEGLDEDNPRQAARMMRKLYETTGMQLGPGMEEGEDPEQIEAEMGDMLESEEPFAEGEMSKGLKALHKQSQRPQVDTTLYEL
jgi:hypothetical protein